MKRKFDALTASPLDIDALSSKEVRELAEQGHAYAQYKVAACAYEIFDFEQTVHWASKGHQQQTGCYEATLLLAFCYARGEGIACDFEKGKDLLASIPSEVIVQWKEEKKVKPCMNIRTIERKQTRWETFQEDTQELVEEANVERRAALCDLLKPGIPSRDVQTYLLEYVFDPPTPKQIVYFHPPKPHPCHQCCSGWLTIEVQEPWNRKQVYSTYTEHCTDCAYTRDYTHCMLMMQCW